MRLARTPFTVPPYTVIVEYPGRPHEVILGWSVDVCERMARYMIRHFGATRCHCAALSLDLKRKPE